MTTEPTERPEGSSEDEDEVDPGWPWSFLLLVAAGALYLILRFVAMFNEYVLN
jgi:hypothetical protein